MRLDVIKSILDLDEKTMKRLHEIRELDIFVRHMEKYILCDPYYTTCIHGNGTYTKKIEDWLKIYDIIYDNDPEDILDHIRWYAEPSIDLKQLILETICRKDDRFDCIMVDEKLPLTNEAKQKILERIKTKLVNLLDMLPIEYLRIIMSIKEILQGIQNEIDNLRSDYQRLHQLYQKLLHEASK